MGKLAHQAGGEVRKLINAICEQALTDRVRGPHDRQRLPLRARLGVQNSKVLSKVLFLDSPKDPEKGLLQEILMVFLLVQMMAPVKPLGKVLR